MRPKMGVFKVMRSIKVAETVGVQISIENNQYLAGSEFIRDAYQWEHRYHKAQSCLPHTYNLFFHPRCGYTAVGK